MTGLNYIQVLLPLRLKWEPIYSCTAEDRDRIVYGTRVKVAFGGKEYVGVVTSADAKEEAATLGADKIKPISGIVEGLENITPEELLLWRQISSYYLCTSGEVYKAAYPAGKVDEEEVKARVKERLSLRLAKLDEKIEKARKEETRQRYLALRQALRQAQGPAGEGVQGPVGEPVEPPELSEAQKEAYSRIKDIFKEGKPALLRGVTGSGKTEIYLKLAREAIDKGRNVLFMVPEIALSRQLEERIRAFFPGELKVVHSAETASNRAEAASFIRDRKYLVLGTRSAIFLPHRSLGLVIVDEEHDQSYKQDNPAPRYNGREAAIMLARIFNADIVLGSATPSLESVYNCSVGRFGLAGLDKRYYDSEDSEVEIIDTIAERRKNGMVGSFSRKLIERIKETLGRGGQVAILRERRSYSPLLQCEECGDIPKCPSCNAALSFHKREDGTGKMVCHYCGRVMDYSGTCNKCGGNLKPLGACTQKIEEETKTLFPDARIARLDSDSARKRKQETEVIRDFSEGRIDILIGTRMVAKGFDFSGLSLVAVMQADSLLGQQDYRADEHALQLLEQFRGRCGRRNEKGLFVIQTSQPDHPVYKSILDNSLRTSSLPSMLTERMLFSYPPYSRIVNVLVKDYNLSRVELMSRELAAAMRGSRFGAGVKIIGPYSPAVDKVARENIRIIRLLLPKDKSLTGNKITLTETVEVFEKERKYIGHISLDVDPV
ncbi:MAG: primosomal protein N' [Bacteroidales bacterium]|nr:primosomal protein N' [Bacteroidales bacterium]